MTRLASYLRPARRAGVRAGADRSGRRTAGVEHQLIPGTPEMITARGLVTAAEHRLVAVGGGRRRRRARARRRCGGCSSTPRKRK